MENKLKTLKDIEVRCDFNHITEDYEDTDYIHIDDLRQEAIKWVKHFRKFRINSKHTMENDFTKFFNITEEDLNGK